MKKIILAVLAISIIVPSFVFAKQATLLNLFTNQKRIVEVPAKFNDGDVLYDSQKFGYIYNPTNLTGYAKYIFGANNFSGSGNITTTGSILATSSVFTNSILGSASSTLLTNSGISWFGGRSYFGEYLGIGSTDPTTSLHINTNKSPLAIFERDGVTANAAIDLKNGDNIYWELAAGGSGAAAPAGFHFMYNTNTTANSKMVITSAGNVGIGTTSPSQKLYVWGNLNVGTSSTPVLYADSGSGNVGIGTSLPLQRLDVNGGIGITSGLTGSSYPEGLYLDKQSTRARILSSVGGSETVAGNLALGVMATDGSPYAERMTIIPAGIGIGTSTPTSMLHIANSTAAATSTISVGSDYNSKGACLELRDSDGAGTSYCTILDGTLSCSTTSCK